MSIRVALADDHQIFLDSLALLVQTLHGVEVAGTFANGRELVDSLNTQTPDLVLTDVTMPEMTGIEVILHVRQHFPSVKVLVLTMLEDRASIEEALRVGASGYVFKSASRHELENAIRTVCAGGKYYSDGLIDKLMTPAENNGAAQPDAVLTSLTDRELEVLRLVARECSSQQIANALFISLNTVETHRRNLFRKLGVKNAVGLIKFAIKHGLADD